jgi:hypothetical protein
MHAHLPVRARREGFAAQTAAARCEPKSGADLSYMTGLLSKQLTSHLVYCPAMARGGDVMGFYPARVRGTHRTEHRYFRLVLRQELLQRRPRGKPVQDEILANVTMCDSSRTLGPPRACTTPNGDALRENSSHVGSRPPSG